MTMGSFFSCFSNAAGDDHISDHRNGLSPQRRRGFSTTYSPTGASRNWSKASAGGKMEDGVMTHEQALAAATLLLRHSSVGGGGASRIDRSASVRQSQAGAAAEGKRKGGLPRSSSSRPRSLTDDLVQPPQLLSQDLKIEDLETSQFVLVHGGGFGAWCWYKTIALLEDSGFKVKAIDLTSSGAHFFDANKVKSLAQYVQPLTDFLEKLSDEEKVILVGHDFGGACISYAMEAFPSKVAKAVYISAAMLTNGQSTLDIFSQQEGENDLMKKAQIFLYANGNDHPPTAIEFEKSSLKDLFFNQSSLKDIALASVSIRPMPFAPVLQKLSLTKEKYGSVRRFFIETTDDNAIPLSLQQNMCSSSPPEKVFRLKGSDHSPFFSKPQALHKHLVEISKIPQTKV